MFLPNTGIGRNWYRSNPGIQCFYPTLVLVEIGIVQTPVYNVFTQHWYWSKLVSVKPRYTMFLPNIGIGRNRYRSNPGIQCFYPTLALVEIGIIQTPVYNVLTQHWYWSKLVSVNLRYTMFLPNIVIGRNWYRSNLGIQCFYPTLVLVEIGIGQTPVYNVFTQHWYWSK